MERNFVNLIESPGHGWVVTIDIGLVGGQGKSKQEALQGARKGLEALIKEVGHEVKGIEADL